MKTYKETIEGKEFLIVELVPVRQKGREFYIGKMPANDLLHVCTVEPTRYDILKEIARKATDTDYEDYFANRIGKDRGIPPDLGAERELSTDRVKKIRKFLNEEEFAFFPNNIIVTCDLMNDVIDIGEEAEVKDLVRSGNAVLPILINTRNSTLYIPFEENSLLVVDGQHRLAGLNEADVNVKEGYEVLVAFIIGFDRSVTAKLFYTINYEQKPVKKSLLYHLMSEFSKELTSITFMHEVVKILNETKGSPFYTRVKMLGRIDDDTPNEIREKMTISQAFLIEYLERTISVKAMRGKLYPPIFLYYYTHENKRVEIIRFIIRYFQAVSRLKKDEWDNPRESIICNSMSIGAFIKIMHFVFVKMFVEEFGLDPNKIAGVTVDSLMQKLDGIQDMSFSKETYGGASSAGGLNQIMKDILIRIKYLDAKSYEDFTNTYRDNYVTPFKNWIYKNVEEVKQKATT